MFLKEVERGGRGVFGGPYPSEVREALIYNKIERVLLISKRIFDYYNTNFSLEITSKVQK